MYTEYRWHGENKTSRVRRRRRAVNAISERLVSVVLLRRLRTRMCRCRGRWAKYRMFNAAGARGRMPSVQSRPIEVRYFGGFPVAFRRGTTDEDVIMHSFERDIFFPGVPEYRIEQNHVIIDVGAHIGTFSLLAASRARHGTVHAIEPCDDSYRLLTVNVLLNDASNIRTHRLALSDTDGTTSLFMDAGTWGHSTVAVLSQKTEVVSCLRLDSFLDIAAVEACDFFKMNSEGSEFPVLLSSSRETLRRMKTILVLYHLDLWRANTETDLVDHLTHAGFRVQVRNRSASRGWIVATRLD